MVALIGFIPAIALFVFAYMRFGFGEPWLPSLGYAAATDAALHHRLPLGAAGRLAAVAARRSVPGAARVCEHVGSNGVQLIHCPKMRARPFWSRPRGVW